MAAVVLTPIDPDADLEPLVHFLTTNTFAHHWRPRLGDAQAREMVDSGRFLSDESVGFWIDADGARVGIAVVEGLEDLADGGNPVFDLRLAEAARGRGRGPGVAALGALTDLVFTRWPSAARLEGHTRDDNLAMRATFRRSGWVKEAYHRAAWPVDGTEPRASVTYAVLRRDWASQTSTPIVWDDL